MKRLLSVILISVLMLSAAVVSTDAALSDSDYEQVVAWAQTLAEGETLNVGFGHTFTIIPSYSQVIAEASKRTDIDPGTFPEHILTVDEAQAYGAVYREVQRELVKANALAAMEKLGLDFDDVYDIGYSEETVGQLGMPRRWKLTKEKLLHLAQCSEVTDIWFLGNMPPYESRVEPDPVPLTPQEKLSGTLKARLSWLDDGEVCTVFPQVLRPGSEVLLAAIAAKYGDDVARQENSDDYKAAAQEFVQAYYASAYLALLKELGYMTEDEGAIVAGVDLCGDFGRFSVEANRNEIMRIAENSHVERVELLTAGMYVEAGCEKSVDTESPLFRRLITWGNRKYGETGGLGVSRFRELYTQRDENGASQWTILAVNVGCPPPWEVKCGGTVAGRFVYSVGGYDVFVSGYALYDAGTDEFYALESVNEANYPGLREAVWMLELGNPVGDADLDGKLTILDATLIQRYLVDLDDLEKIGNASYGMCKSPFADTDGDGKITVFDATAIQRLLAGFKASP